MTDAHRSTSHDEARDAHLAAKDVLVRVRATWGSDTSTSTLLQQLEAEADDDVIAGLASLYVFAARIGGRNAEDPAVAVKWLMGWSGARARTPDDGRAALDAGIAFAARLHTAMGIADAP